MGTFEDLKRRLKDNPGLPKPKPPSAPADLNPEVLIAARTTAAAANMFLRSGRSPAETLQALETLTKEMLGGEAAAQQRLNDDWYPGSEGALKRLTGNKEKDLALIKNQLLRVILFVFEKETGGVSRIRLHHANELVAAIQGELG